MNIFEKLVLKDHFMFHDLTWEMDKYKLSTIRGTNLDRTDKSGNATGKSLLPSSLATILNDSPPSAIRKKSSKEGMGPKSDLRFYFSNEHGSFNIHQFMQNKSVKLELFEGKADLRLKGKTDIREEVKRILPITEETFFSQIYISSFRPPAMFNGKASDRLNYFEQIFNMRFYDLLKKRWSKKLTDLGKIGSVHKELNSQKASLEEYVDRGAEKKLKKLKDRHSDIMSTYQTTNLEIQKLISQTVLMEQIDDSATEDSIKKQIKQLTGDINTNKGNLKELRCLQKAYDRYKEIKDKKKQIKLRIQKIKESSAYIENAKEKLKKAYSAKHGLEGHMDSAEMYAERIRQYRDAQKAVEGKKKPELSTKKLASKLSKMEVEHEQLSKLKAGEPCPLCSHKVSSSHKHDLKKLVANINKMEECLEISQNYDIIEELKAQIPKAMFRYKEEVFQKELDKVDAEIEALEKSITMEKSLDKLEGMYESLPEVEKAETKVTDKEIEKLENRIEKQIRQKDTLNKNLQVMEKVAKLGSTLSLKDARKALKAKKAWIKEVTPEIKDIGEKIDKLTSASARSRASIEQIKDIDTKLSDMEEKLSQKAVLEELVKACSHKGVILIETQSLAEAYVQKMNMIAKGIFLEPISFSANVDNTKFDIFAHRSGTEGDIRSLCGSERGQFLPISALALMSLMPSSQRTNLMIMDELDGNMSIPEKRMFSDHFIPRVSETIRNTVVITPKDKEEFSIPNSEELMLIRKDKITNWSK